MIFSRQISSFQKTKFSLRRFRCRRCATEGTRPQLGADRALPARLQLHDSSVETGRSFASDKETLSGRQDHRQDDNSAGYTDSR